MLPLVSVSHVTVSDGISASVSSSLRVAVKGDPEECGLEYVGLTEDRIEESEAEAGLEELVAKIETLDKRWKNLSGNLKFGSK